MLPPEPNRSRRPGAFTVTELLVAITLIAVLVVLGMATFSRATVAMNNSRCLDNLRTLAQACFAYATDHQLRLPFHYREGARWSGYGEPLWYVAVAPYLGGVVKNEIVGEVIQADALICPADKVPWVGAAGFTPSCSYAFPISLTARNPDGTQHDGEFTVHMVTRFYQPSATVLLIDSAYANIFNIYNYATSSGSINDPQETGRELIGRHKGHLNAVFADGHCEPIPGNTPSFDPNRPHLWGRQAF